jgi:hypothetical protein
VVVRGAQCRAESLVAHGRPPEQEEVVEVQQPQGSLTRDEGGEDVAHVPDGVRAPRRRLAHHLTQGGGGVDDARVQARQGGLLGEASRPTHHAELPANEVHQVGGVHLVDDAEPVGQAQRRGVVAQRAVGDGVKGAARHATGAVVAPRGAHAADHVARGASGEGEQQDSLR